MTKDISVFMGAMEAGMEGEGECASPLEWMNSKVEGALAEEPTAFNFSAGSASDLIFKQ